MKKKFVRVMFFGALALATGASFVGCKDYDDDIDAVNARVDGIEKTLSELQAQLGGFVKSVDYNASTGVLTVVGGNNESFNLPMPQAMPSYTLNVTKDGKITLLKDGKEVSSGTIDIPEMPEIPDMPEIPEYKEFDASLLTVGEDGYIYYSGKKTQVQIPASPKGSIVATTTEEGTVTGYTITTYENGKQYVGSFSIIDAVALRGLVFSPSCYVGGIPSLKASNIAYNPWTREAYATPTEKGETYKAATVQSYITPQIWAYYHMNPAGTSMEQIESLKFLSGDKDYYPVSRAAAMNPTVNMSKTEVVTQDGERYLKVAMDADAEKIPAIKSGKVASYALQAQTKDAAVITSNYASVYKVSMEDFVLKTTLDNTAKDEVVLYGQAISRADTDNANAGKAQEAIDAEADYTVATDAELKLADKIVTYYKEDGKDELVEMENVEDYGLEYVYTASNYIGGAKNETEQNTFINVDKAAEGIIDPEYNKQNSEATENREPLLRVELKDKATGKTVAVGWIKTKIVKGATEGFAKTFDKGTYYYGCGNFDEVLTYINMNDVYDKAKLNKDEFHKAYKLKVDAANAVVMAIGSVGTVTEIVDNPATATNVLKWIVTPAEALAVVNASKTEMSATVTYESVDGTRGNITITMKAKVAMPSGVIKNDQKIKQVWSTDYSYVKADVKEPVSTAVTDFTLDLFNVFEGRKVVVSDVDSKNFPSFANDELNAKFIFSGAKEVTIGTDKYTFTVASDGTQLRASKNGSVITTLIATIDAKGVITYNKDEEDAQVLLNNSAYNEDPFTVGVEIVITNGCDEILPITGNKFDVKFLRPINIVDTQSASLQDATTGTAKIDMSELFGLTDWRGEKFVVKPVDFYTYYGVDGKTGTISIDKDKIMTTLNASEATPKLLKDVAPQMSISYTCSLQDSGDKKTFGDIVYENGKVTVNESFKLFIPVTVSYTFGEVTGMVTLTITPTHN